MLYKLYISGFCLTGIMLCSNCFAHEDHSIGEISTNHEQCHELMSGSRIDDHSASQRCRTITSTEELQAEEETFIDEQGALRYSCRQLDFSEEPSQSSRPPSFCRHLASQKNTSISFTFPNNQDSSESGVSLSYIMLQLIYTLANLFEVKVHYTEAMKLYTEGNYFNGPGNSFHTIWLMYELTKHITHAANIGFWIPPFSLSSSVELVSSTYELGYTTHKLTSSVGGALAGNGKTVLEGIWGAFDKTSDILGYFSMWLNSAITLYRSVVHDIAVVRIIKTLPETVTTAPDTILGLLSAAENYHLNFESQGRKCTTSNALEDSLPKENQQLQLIYMSALFNSQTTTQQLFKNSNLYDIRFNQPLQANQE